MEDNKNSLAITPVKSFYKFNNTDKSKNKKISISLFQSSMNFKVFSADSDGKMKDKPDTDIYLQSIAYNIDLLVSTCEIMLKRIKDIHAGKDVESDPIIFHNGKPKVDTATNFLSFDTYKKDDGNIVSVIQLKKRNNKDDKDWSSKSNFYLSSGAIQGVFNKGNAIQLKEHYSFFKSLLDVLQGFSDRSANKWDEHWKKFAMTNNNDNNQKSNGGYSKPSNSSDIDDDDDDIF